MGKRIVIHPIFAAIICSAIITGINVIGNLIRKSEVDFVPAVVSGVVTGVVTVAVLYWMTGKKSAPK